MPVSRTRTRDTKKRHGHCFTMRAYYEGRNLIREYGPTVPIVPWRRMPQEVILELTAADVRLAHARLGEGDTRHCAVACLVRRQKDKFLPYVVNGVVEFMDSRAHIGIGRVNHYPVKDMRFEHNYKWLTEMFDSPDGNGWKRVIEKIEEAGGTLLITLRAFRLRLEESSPGKRTSPSDGSRSRISAFMNPRGAHARSMRLDDRSILQAQREASLETAQAIAGT